MSFLMLSMSFCVAAWILDPWETEVLGADMTGVLRGEERVREKRASSAEGAAQRDEPMSPRSSSHARARLLRWVASRLMHRAWRQRGGALSLLFSFLPPPGAALLG